MRITEDRLTGFYCHKSVLFVQMLFGAHVSFGFSGLVYTLVLYLIDIFIIAIALMCFFSAFCGWWCLL